MSVSEGLKKYNKKNFNVKVVSLDDGNESKLKIQPWTRTIELKSKIAEEFGVPKNHIRLFFHNIEMIDRRTMLDYSIIDTKDAKIYFRLSDKDQSKAIQVYAAFPCSTSLKKIIDAARLAMLVGIVPTMTMEGTSGTYLIKDNYKKTIALFKPIDEEAFAPNNKKGYSGKFGQESFRKGILSGEGSIREVAAYLLDRDGFFSVPDTTFVEITHPSFNCDYHEMLCIDDQSMETMKNSIIHKYVLENVVQTNGINNTGKFISSEIENNSLKRKYGSLQRFIKSNDVAANYGSCLFSIEYYYNVNFRDVHRIGILDIRILNCDRNDENLLVLKKKDKNGNAFYKLIPIDHSLSFPDCIEIYTTEMCWMGWNQSQKPFSEECLDYIKNIDIVKEMNKICSKIKIREKCLKFFRISNIVLKKCAEHGLTLYEIGKLLYRANYHDDNPSEIEIIVEKAEKISSIFSKIQPSTINLIEFNKENKDDIENSNSKRKLTMSSSFNTRKILEDIPYEKNSFVHNTSNSNSTILKKETSLNCLSGFNLQINLMEKEEKKEKIKKNGLLKRTASEKNLLKYENSENLENDYNFHSHSKPHKKLSQFKQIQKNEIKDDPNSPFNELYFYNFEQLLVEYLNKNYEKKTISLIN